MKVRSGQWCKCLLLAMALFAGGAINKTFSQTASFTYQGRLQDGGNPGNGSYDFQFTLWDALSGGAQQPQPLPVTVTTTAVVVTNGIFTVQLDFGANAFPGANRWLEISTRLAGGGAFTILAPRQPITATPYAVRSASAGTADSAATATNATQLGGIAASNYLQTVSKNSTLTGNGANGAPLGVAVPLQLSGNLVGNIISGTNSNTTGSGVYGTTSDPGDGNGGVTGDAPNGDGVVGRGGRAGVFGLSSTGVGVNGHSNSSSFAGVLGFNSSSGSGVQGLANSGKAIYGQSTNGFAGYFEGQSYFSGNVGIGTTNPSSLLHVTGSQPPAVTSGDGTSAAPALQIIGGKGGNSNTQIAWFGGTGGGILIQGGQGGDGPNGGLGGSLTLQPGQPGSGPQGSSGPGTVLLAPSGGNVGIGTIFPVTRFHVVGNSTFGGNGAFGGNVSVVAPGGREIFLGGGNLTGSELKLTNSGTAHFSIYNSGNGSLTFANTNANISTNTPGSPLMSITSAGNVGIGTTGPGFRLHVNGETRTNTLSIDSYVANNGGPALCANTSNNRIALCTSSLRYKTNVRSFDEGLKLISRLRPIRFNWLDGGVEDIGLAAEDVDELEPLLAFRNNRAQVEGVKYDRIGVVLINAVKEQQAQIESQREQIKQQQAQLQLQEHQASQQRVAFAAQQQQLDALKKLVCRSHRRATVCRSGGR